MAYGGLYMDYSQESERIKTFTSWPRNTGQTPRGLAAEGFTYIGPPDYVQCFFCGLTLHAWTSENNPLAEHFEKAKGLCTFAEFRMADYRTGKLNLKSGNVQRGRRDADKDDRLGSFTSVRHRSSGNSTFPVSAPIYYDALSDKDTATVPHVTANGLVKPKAEEEYRISTTELDGHGISGSRGRSSLRSDTMLDARAMNSRRQLIYESNQIFVNHVENFDPPISSVECELSALNDARSEISLLADLEQRTRTPSNSSLDPKVPIRYHVNSAMDTDVVQLVLGKGYEWETVKAVVSQRLQVDQDYFTDAAELLRAVFDYEDACNDT